MKFSPFIIKMIFGAILALSVLLGIKVASFSYKYEVVTEGLLGSFFLYLFWRFFRPSREEDYDEYTFSQGVKLIVSAFVYSILCFWAIVRVANLIELVFEFIK